MIPYWLLFFAAATPAITSQGNYTPARRSAAALLLGITITLFVGLRFEVGTDWPNYMAIFESIRQLDLGDALEISDPGFAALNWVVAQLGIDYWIVNLFCAAVFTAGLFKFVARLPNPWLALAAGVPYLIVVVAMGYTRQAVALGCLMWGLSGVSRASFLRFMVWVLIAATFHRSIIVVLPVVGLAYTRNRFVSIALAILTAILIYYLFLSASLDSTLSSYNDEQIDSQGAAIRVMMNLVPAIIFLFTSRRFLIDESERALWHNFSIAALVCVPLLFLAGSTTLIDRAALYIIPLQLFVFSWLPSIFLAGGLPSQPLTFGILTYSAIVQYIWLNYGSHAQDWLPYQLYPIFN